jgi:hypothetical protein
MWILFVLVLTILSQTAAAQGPVLIDYVIDASQPGKKAFQIQAKIERLPHEHPVIIFPGMRLGSEVLPGKLLNIGLLNQDEEFLPLVLEEDRVAIQNSAPSPLVLSYGLQSGPFFHLDKTSYLDESRAVFHPQNILLQIEGQSVKSRLSFLLPSGWQVVTTATAISENAFEPRPLDPFYLGGAKRARQAIGNTEFYLAFEPDWPSSLANVTESLRQQLNYRRSFARGASLEPLLAVFLSATKPLHHQQNIASFATSKLLVLSASRGLAEIDLQRVLRQELSRSLIRCYFPALQNFAERLNPSEAIDYLSFKACLKTGLLTPVDFLQIMAEGLWRTLEADPIGLENWKPVSPQPADSPGRVTRHARQNYFLLDLALAFHGNSVGSLEEFLFTKFAEVSNGPISSVHFRRQLAREERANKLLEELWTDVKVVPISELLRPFGLLFERRELPGFPFELTETFRVAQRRKPSNLPNSGLQEGDRILAINHHQLTMPDDLQKYRSQLGSENEVQLSVERNGVLMKLQQPIEKKVLLRLELNKLADADKREKLEKFLSREPDGA